MVVYLKQYDYNLSSFYVDHRIGVIFLGCMNIQAFHFVSWPVSRTLNFIKFWILFLYNPVYFFYSLFRWSRVRNFEKFLKKHFFFIFQSLSPTFKETLENNETLHHFINYLHSQNSIAILQLYLTLSMYQQHDPNDYFLQHS